MSAVVDVPVGYHQRQRRWGGESQSQCEQCPVCPCSPLHASAVLLSGRDHPEQLSTRFTVISI